MVSRIHDETSSSLPSRVRLAHHPPRKPVGEPRKVAQPVVLVELSAPSLLRFDLLLEGLVGALGNGLAERRRRRDQNRPGHAVGMEPGEERARPAAHRDADHIARSVPVASITAIASATVSVSA